MGYIFYVCIMYKHEIAIYLMLVNKQESTLKHGINQQFKIQFFHSGKAFASKKNFLLMRQYSKAYTPTAILNRDVEGYKGNENNV